MRLLDERLEHKADYVPYPILAIGARNFADATGYVFQVSRLADDAADVRWSKVENSYRAMD